jgi:hypothetical protein
MSKHILSLGFAGILCLLFSGCNEGGDGVVAVSKEDLIGRWSFTSMHMTTRTSVTSNGRTESFKEDTTVSLAGMNHYAQFNQDLTFSSDIPLQSLGWSKRSASAFAVAGTWSVTGNTITAIPSGDLDTLAMAAVVSGNSGTFTLVNESTGVIEINSEEMAGGGTYTTTITSAITATKAATQETEK